MPLFTDYYSGMFSQARTPEEWMAVFFKHSSFSLPMNYSMKLLGPGMNEPYVFPEADLRSILCEVLNQLPDINCRTFILAFHFAYALLRQQDLDQVRAIVLHHHLPITVYLNFGAPTSVKPMVDETLRQTLQLFPQMKVMHCIRNPFDLYRSTMEIIQGELAEHLKTVYQKSWICLLGYFQATHLAELMGPDQYMFVKLESMHLAHRETMDAVCRYLNIAFSETLQESTFDGKIWWGKYPKTAPLNGINPDFKENTWLGRMDDGTLALCNAIFRTLAVKHGYHIPERRARIPNVYLNWTQYECKAYKALVRDYLRSPIKHIRTFLPVILSYPLVRTRFMFEMCRAAKTIGRSWPKLDYRAFWMRRNKAWMQALPYRQNQLPSSEAQNPVGVR